MENVLKYCNISYLCKSFFLCEQLLSAIVCRVHAIWQQQPFISLTLQLRCLLNRKPAHKQHVCLLKIIPSMRVPSSYLPHRTWQTLATHSGLGLTKPFLEQRCRVRIARCNYFHTHAHTHTHTHARIPNGWVSTLCLRFAILQVYAAGAMQVFWTARE